MSNQDEMFDEVRQTLRDLRSWITECGYGVRPRVSLLISDGAPYQRLDQVNVYVYLDEGKDNTFETSTKSTLGEVIDDLKVKIVARCTKRDDEVVTKMALKIIETRHTRGVVTDRDLSMDFSEFHLKRLLTTAVERANEMAADAPFEVQMVREQQNANPELESEVPF